MIEFAKFTDKNIDENLIPIKYLEIIADFINSNKFGTISLVIQSGKIVGCDILEKDRLADR